MSSSYSIILADDHAMLRRRIKKIIEENPELKVIAEVGDGLELMDYLEKNIAPDLVILDISLPNIRGIEATRKIKEEYPGIKVLILTMHKVKEYMDQALTLGANGYLLKQDIDDELIAAILSIRNGDNYICLQMRP